MEQTTHFYPRTAKDGLKQKTLHDFASKQSGRRDFAYPAIYAHIKKVFGAKWDMIPSSRFGAVAEHMQRRIDGTRLGRINASKGIRNYSSFTEYQRKYGDS